MFLSLPLPLENDRVINIVLVRKENKTMLLKYAVKVSKMGTIMELKEQLGILSGLKPENLVLADIHANRIYSYLSETRSVSTIRDTDVTFAFEVLSIPPKEEKKVEKKTDKKEDKKEDKKDDKSDEIARIQFVHRTQNIDPVPNSYYSKNQLKLFSYPFLLSLPKTITRKELYLRVWNSIKRFLRTEQEIKDIKEKKPKEDKKKDDDVDEIVLDTMETLDFSKLPFQLVYVSQTGMNCGVCSALTKSCTGCTISSKDKSMTFKSTTIAIQWANKDYKTYYSVDKAEYVILHSSVQQQRQAAQQKQVQALTLNDCLKAFTNNERLGPNDPWFCPSCKALRQAWKKFDLWKLPEILVVHLKRFQFTRYYREKLNLMVRFPITNLDLSATVLTSQTEAPIYDLYAISNHSGNLGAGHYTAFAKNREDNKWYLFNDSSCKQVEEASISSESAYVLFYMRRNSTK